jgi:hypothetical protein
MWALAPMPEVGPLVAARRGGALPRGGSTLLVQRFAFLIVGHGEDEGAHYPGALACSLCDSLPSSHSKTSVPTI